MAMSLRCAMISSLVTLSIVSTLSYKDCGDLKIICNRKDPMCCEGSCCPLLDHFQFISTPTPDNGPFPTPEPTPSAKCANVGDTCSSSKPRGEECCAGSGTRCQFAGSDVDGHLFGTCCFPKDTKGCTVDSDCCGADNKCLANMCLASATADAIGARWVSYGAVQPGQASTMTQHQLSSYTLPNQQSSAAAQAANAQAANARTVKMDHFSVDTAHDAVDVKEHPSWRHAEIFAMVMVAVTVVLVIVGFSPMVYRRLSTKRSMQEIEDLSVATVSITESDEECLGHDDVGL